MTNLTVTVNDTGKNGELYISWVKPMKESNTCEVSQYQIDYTLVRYLALSENETNTREQSVQVNGSEYDITLKELEDYARYKVSVTPITSWSDENDEEFQFGNTIENSEYIKPVSLCCYNCTTKYVFKTHLSFVLLGRCNMLSTLTKKAVAVKGL